MKKINKITIIGLVALTAMIWIIASVTREESAVIKAGESYRRMDKLDEWAGTQNILKLEKECIEVCGKVFWYAQEVILHPIEDYPNYTTGEEILSYYQDRYPDMCRMEAYLLKEYNLWDHEEEMFDRVFYVVEEPEATCGFFLWEGKYYEVICRGEKAYEYVKMVRDGMDYDYDSLFSWQQEADGSIMMLNNLKSDYFFIKDLGGEEKMRLQAKIIGSEPGESAAFIYLVEIYDEKGEEVLQELQVMSNYSHESPFVFEDFNADGYLDLTVRYFYGANGGTASHYIFSPSKGVFVKLDSSLDYYCTYSVDYETRRLYMTYHGSAFSGTALTYQWSDEMDYELIKLFAHEGTPDIGMQVSVSRYDKGEEELICDYRYTCEEFLERFEDFERSYDGDFIWEKEITDKTNGKKYMIRYMEIYNKEAASHNKGIYYEGWLYVYDEDTYLIQACQSDHILPSSSITWDDENQELVLQYEEGAWTIPISSLIIKDYHPSEQ